MGATSFTEKLTSTAPAAKLFKAIFLDAHLLAPKLYPHLFAGGAIVEGDGGEGSVRQFNLITAAPFNSIKERFDVLNKDTLEAKLTLIEGLYIGTKLESATSYTKIEPAGSGGSVYTVTLEFKPIAGTDLSNEIAEVKNVIIGSFKAIDAYVVANPDYA